MIKPLSTENAAALIDSPVGKIRIRMQDDVLVELSMSPEEVDIPNFVDEAAKPVQQALEAYFADSRAYEVPKLFTQGTPFQQKVWHFIREIPPGEVLTYGQVAKMLDTGPRAVGGACRANPVTIFVPCHRVVSSAGLGGYAGRVDGFWPKIKQILLRHEGVKFA